MESITSQEVKTTSESNSNHKGRDSWWAKRVAAFGIEKHIKRPTTGKRTR